MLRDEVEGREPDRSLRLRTKVGEGLLAKKKATTASVARSKSRRPT